MGFFKKTQDDILKGDNFVFSPNVTLTKETKDDYTYPQDGWYWFDSFDEALRFFAEAKSSDSITPRQARLILLQNGLLDEVEALLASDRTLQIWWEYSQEIKRNHPYVVSFEQALNLTPEQLDDMFIEASKL